MLLTDLQTVIDELFELACDEKLDSELFIARAMELICDAKEISDALSVPETEE